MLKLGFCVTGSFCSMDKMIDVLDDVSKIYDVEVFITPNVESMNTRFYTSKELKKKIIGIVHKKIHTTIQEAEVYGPLKKVDIVLVYPCDACTLSKLYYGINDNVVTMLVKSSLRNDVPIVLGVCSNDVLSYSGEKLFALMSKKNYYFVPMYQDQYEKKPNSMVACKEKVIETLEKAYNKKQIQPFMLGYKEIK